MALEVKECISYKYKAKRKNYERESRGYVYFGINYDWTINNLLHLVDSLCERKDYKQCTM